jgi:hypothetical protein
VGPTLAAFAHLHGLQSGYVPPILSDDIPAGTPQPPYPAQTFQTPPAFQPRPSQQHPAQPHIAQPFVSQASAQAYQPQPYGYAEQPPAAQQYPYGSPYSGQPHMPQPYPGQQIHGQPIHGQPPAYAHPAPQPYAPAPGYGHLPPHGAAQPYGQPAPYHAAGAQSLHMQQYGHQPAAGYAIQPGYPAHAAQPTQPAPYPAAVQPTERFTVQPPFTPGYSEQPPRALLGSAEDRGGRKPWQLSDDAPRYLPPGTSEADLDPFGLSALPEHAAYHGPKELPSEAVYGLLFGLCSLLLFPLGFLGFVRARRAGSMIDAAPSHFRGRFVVLLGFALNMTCPILSVAAGAYLFGLI